MTGSQDLWSPDNYIKVMIRNLETEAHVGLHAWERHPERPQRLIVNAELYAHQHGPHRSGTLESVLDYDIIRNAVRSWPGRQHTPLLENLVEELVTLCLSDPRVEACRVSVTKPDIYNDAEGAGVEVFRRRQDKP